VGEVKGVNMDKFRRLAANLTLTLASVFSVACQCPSRMVLGSPFQRVLYPQVFTRNIHHPRMPQRQSLLSAALSDEGRATSAPPRTIHTSSTTRSASIPRGSSKLSPSASDTHFPKEPKGATSLDLIDLLERSEQSLVKTRSGSVLSRGFILKTDHYPSGFVYCHEFARVTG